MELKEAGAAATSGTGRVLRHHPASVAGAANLAASGSGDSDSTPSCARRQGPLRAPAGTTPIRQKWGVGTLGTTSRGAQCKQCSIFFSRAPPRLK